MTEERRMFDRTMPVRSTVDDDDLVPMYSRGRREHFLTRQKDLPATGVFDVTTHGATGDGSTDDSAAIQAAIDAAATNGGTVFFPAGTYIVSSSIELKNGVNLSGVYPGPVYDGQSPNFCAGAIMDLDGAKGTVLKASTTGITCFTNNVQDLSATTSSELPISVNIDGLGFLDFETVVKSGGRNQYGFGYCTWQNIRVQGNTDWVFQLYNFQGLHLSRVFCTDCTKAANLIQQQDVCQNGNSVWTDVFFDVDGATAPAESMLIESRYEGGGSDSMNFITFIRLQINQFVSSAGDQNAILRIRGESTNAFENYSTSGTALTVDTGADTFTLTNHKISDGTRLKFTEVGTLPTGVNDTDTFYARDCTATTFKVAATLGGDAIDLTGSPTNDNTVANPGAATINGWQFIGLDLEGVCGIMVDVHKGNNILIDPTAKAGTVGTEHIRFRNCDDMWVNCVKEDFEINSDDTQYFWNGSLELSNIKDRPPQAGVYFDKTENAQVYSAGYGYFLGSAGSVGLEARVESNNTWPGIGTAPVYHTSSSGTTTLANTRWGTSRFSGMSGAITVTLPSVTSVPNGVVGYLLNDDATHSITLTAGGSDTINGTDQDLTIGPKQVAQYVANNRGSATDWVAWVVAVADS